MAMNAARFEELASAYGADFRRWPQAERPAAEAFAAQNRSQAERLLFEARLIDAALAAAPSMVPSRTLREQVLQRAPAPRPQRRWSGWFWVPASGLAAACAAGAIVGVVAMEGATAGSRTDIVLAANTDSGWSEVDPAGTL
jgi:hypothetical protein